MPIFLQIENGENIQFDYFCNSNATFQELFEFIANLYSNLNICSCYNFRKDNSVFDINLNETLFNCYSSEKKIHITLYRSKKNCSCDELYKKYLKQPKKIIIRELNDLNNKIEAIKKKAEKNENEPILLNDKKTEDENQILLLKKEKEAQTDKINSLNQEIQKKEKELNDLKAKSESQINDLKKEKKILEMAIDGNIEKIEMLKEIGMDVSHLKPKENIIKIDKNNQIVGEANNLFNKEQFMNFYDVIVNIKSIKDINKGWSIKLNKDNYENYKNEKTIKIGVIGNSNKGKSFLLSKISKISLPSGTSIRTEGLSIKYPHLSESFKDRRIVLLDSAGLETPVLKEEEKYKDKDNGENEENIGRKEKETIEGEGEKYKPETELVNGQQIEFKDQSTSKEEKKEDIVKIFQEKSREKLITEIFLQNYIIFNSNILIIVIGILTYSEQKLLNRIRNEISKNRINKPLFIIHNLITYTTKEQVEEYVEEFLLKSVTFNLEEGHKISTKTDTKSGKYFYEKNTDPKVFHLLFANESSPAGKIYNEFTLQFLENNYQNVTDIEPFDVVETIKERFIQISKDIIEQSEKIEFDESKEEIIKLNSPKDITLKKCLIDELGFSNLKSNGFEPAYNYYKKDNKIIVKVEIPGNCEVKSKLNFAGEYTIIKISGEKKKDKEPEKLNSNIINKRELGPFSLNIYLKTEDYLLKNKDPNSVCKKGVYIIEYEMENKNQEVILNNEKEDEI